MTTLQGNDFGNSVSDGSISDRAASGSQPRWGSTLAPWRLRMRFYFFPADDRKMRRREDNTRYATELRYRFDWFGALSILVVLLNLVALALFDPTGTQQSQDLRDVLSDLEYFFVVFFAFETVMRILCLGARPVLTKTWNLLDLIVVVSSALALLLQSVFPQLSSVSGLRAVRVLRPLRAFSRIPEIRVVINSMVKSLRYLADVGALYLLFVIAMGCAGIALFAGQLERRCVRNEYFLFDVMNTTHIDELASGALMQARACALAQSNATSSSFTSGSAQMVALEGWLEQEALAWMLLQHLVPELMALPSYFTSSGNATASLSTRANWNAASLIDPKFVVALFGGGYNKASYVCGAFVDGALHRLQRAAALDYSNITDAAALSQWRQGNNNTNTTSSTNDTSPFYRHPYSCTLYSNASEGLAIIAQRFVEALVNATEEDAGQQGSPNEQHNVNDWTGSRSCDASMTCDDSADTESLFYGLSCPYGYTCSAVSNPAFGFMSFDNIGFAILTVLTTVTTEPFPALLAAISSSTTKFTGGMFGIVLIVVGSLFIVNLLVALISVEFEKCRTEEAARRHQEAVIQAVLAKSSFASASSATAGENGMIRNRGFRVHVGGDSQDEEWWFWKMWARFAAFQRKRLQRQKAVFRYLRSSTPRRGGSAPTTPNMHPAMELTPLRRHTPLKAEQQQLHQLGGSGADAPLLQLVFDDDGADDRTHTGVTNTATALGLTSGIHPGAKGTTTTTSPRPRHVSFAGRPTDGTRLPPLPPLSTPEGGADNVNGGPSFGGTSLLLLPSSLHGTGSGLRGDSGQSPSFAAAASPYHHHHRTNRRRSDPSSTAGPGYSRPSPISSMEDVSLLERVRFSMHSHVVNTRPFFMITSLMMMVMLVSMSVDYYGMPQGMTDALDVINIFFTIFITVEIAMRLVAADPFLFFFSGEHLTGVVVLIISWVDVASTNFNLPVVRALRLVVAVKLLRYFPTLYGHFLIMVNSFRASLILVCVIALELLIFACLGMQVLGGRTCTVDTESRFLQTVESGQLGTTADWLPWDYFFLPSTLDVPVSAGGLATFTDYAGISMSSQWWWSNRTAFVNASLVIPSLTAANLPQDSVLCTPLRMNFNSFGYAMLSSFSILASDNWNDLMAQSLTTYDDGVPFALVAGLFCLQYYAGVYVLLNLFIAILMSSTEKLFGDAGDGRDDGADDVLSSAQQQPSGNAEKALAMLGAANNLSIASRRSHRRSLEGKDILLEDDEAGDDGGSSSSSSDDILGDSDDGEDSSDDFLTLRKNPSILTATRTKAHNSSSALLGPHSFPAVNLNDFAIHVNDGGVEIGIDADLAALDARDHQQGLISLAAHLEPQSLNSSVAGASASIEGKQQLTSVQQAAARVVKLQRRALIEHKRSRAASVTPMMLPRAPSSEDGSTAQQGPPFARLQATLLAVLDHPLANAFMIVAVLTSTIALALENITLPPDAPSLVTLSIIDDVCSGIFILEFSLRVIGKGIRQTFWGKTPWNWLEAFLVACNIADLVLSHGFRNERNVAHIVRALYVLRPLRILRRTAGIRMVARSLLGALRPLKDVVVVGFVVYVVAAIMGVQLFKGSMRSCSTSPRPILTEDACVAAGYLWENTGYNFDHLGQALLSLFVVSSLEQWQQVLFAAMDAVDAGVAPQQDANPAAALYVITFAVIGGFFFVSLFVSVLIRSYEREKMRMRRVSVFLTEQQEQWLVTQRSVLASMPLSEFLAVPPSERSRLSSWNNVRAVLIQVSLHPAMLHVVNAAVITSMVCSAAQHYPRTDGFDTALNTVNTVVTVVYLLEAMIKLIAVHPELYFSSSWNRFDFLILLVSIVDVVLAYTSVMAAAAGISRALRLCRAARLLRLAQSSKRLSRIVTQFTHSLYGLMNVAAFLVLLIASYALAAMWTFGALFKDGTVITVYQNFDTFINSAMSLMQLLFGGDWSVMTACSRDELTRNLNPDLVWDAASTCTERIGNCGNEPLAVLLFISYFVLGRYVLLNIFIAVIVESFRGDERGSGSRHAGAITEHDIKVFVETWVSFDRDRRLYIATRDLLPMLQCLPAGHPFAPEKDSVRPPAYDAPPRQRRRFLVRQGFDMLMFLAPLGLEERHGCIEFFDVLTALLRHVTKCETVDTLVEPARLQFEQQFRFRLQCRTDPATIAMAAATSARRRERAEGQMQTMQSVANQREVLVFYSAAFLADVWKGCAAISRELMIDRKVRHETRASALRRKTTPRPDENNPRIPEASARSLRGAPNSSAKGSRSHQESSEGLIELEALLLGDTSTTSGHFSAMRKEVSFGDVDLSAPIGRSQRWAGDSGGRLTVAQRYHPDEKVYYNDDDDEVPDFVPRRAPLVVHAGGRQVVIEPLRLPQRRMRPPPASLLDIRRDPSPPSEPATRQVLSNVRQAQDHQQQSSSPTSWWDGGAPERSMDSPGMLHFSTVRLSASSTSVNDGRGEMRLSNY